MKKLVFVLLLFLICGVTIAQDWHPFPEDQTSYFADIPTDSTSKYQYKYINTLRIDSITLLHNKYYYYNMRSPVRIGGEDYYTYYDPYSSWIGKFMNVYGNDVLFSDKSGKNYTIDLYKTGDHPHYSARINDTSILLVNFDSITYGPVVDGLMDSLKYFSFHYHRNWDTPLDHEINGKQMVFSKNYGLVKTLSFGLMSSIEKLEEKEIIGLLRNDEAYGYQWDMDSITTSYRIGDEYHVYHDEDDWYHQFYLIDKQIEENSINYIYQDCIDKNNPRLDTVHQRIQINLMPGQSNFRGEKGFYYVHMYKDDFFGRRTYLLQYYDDIEETYFANQYVWGWEWPGTNNGIFPPYYHINIAGKYLYWNNYQHDYHELLYYSNQVETWGEPHTFPCNVGIEEYQNLDMLVAPNPSSGIIYLNSSEKIEEVKVYNLNGQIVKTVYEIENGVLDLSDLNNGVYLLSILNQNLELNHQKMIINK